MTNAERFIRSLLETADIRIDGNRPWDIQIHDPRLYERVAREGNLGLGEAYMDGWWDCEHIDQMIHRVLKAHLDETMHPGPRQILAALPAHLFNLQSLRGARVVARKHYDLGNDLFLSFLDSHNQYSCGYFNGCEDLEEAQHRKLELICDKLELKPDDTLLDIGCGWGGLARYAAETRGCRVTAVNISREQTEFARENCSGLPVSVLRTDYRAVDGQFDKIVSVGMFEHVGAKNYRTFMRACHRLLKAGGTFLLHTIGGNKATSSCDPWINRYIFPRGMLPSTAQLSKAAEGLFVMEDWHNLGPHYDRTLMAWHKRFTGAWSGLKTRYSETFKRMWEYYLLSCAGAFRARDIQLWQVVFTKPGTPQPHCRLG